MCINTNNIKKLSHNHLNTRRRLGRRVRTDRSRGCDGGGRGARAERRVRLQSRRRGRPISDRLSLYKHGDRGSGAEAEYLMSED